MITEFKEKKLVEYLKDGQKILIRFGHGWGDTQMFMPIFYRIRELYPNILFDIYLECGQEDIFGKPQFLEDEYDLVFSLNFPMSEGSHLTKQEKCCLEEIGIEGISEIAILPPKNSPIISVHFQGTCLPNSVNCPYDVSKQIWQEIKDFGKIPIECHFQHIFHNPLNKKYDFIDNSVRNYKANLHNLIGIIQNSYAFIGVASGPLVTALSVMPERTMFLQRHHEISNYTKKKITYINVFDYKKGEVIKWLKNMPL